MAFTLPPLPYAYDALEPAIDKETMTFHHDKHHQTYVDNLNKAVDADSALQGQSLEQMFAKMSNLPKAVRNNGGGNSNHRRRGPVRFGLGLADRSGRQAEDHLDPQPGQSADGCGR